MSFLSHVRAYKSVDLSDFIPVYIAGVQIGWTPETIAKLFHDYDDTWNLNAKGLFLNDKFETFEDRTRALDAVFIGLAIKGLLPTMPDYSMFGEIDWYPVRESMDAPILCIVKRFYSAYLGIQFESVMLHGYYGDTYWVGKRSDHVHDAPGMLDIMSAGSVTYGQTLDQALAYEALDEAGLEAEDLSKIVKTDVIELYYLDGKGLFKHEVFHVYELDTDDTIIPHTRRPIEVAGFQAMDIAELTRRVDAGECFKGQVNLVMVDFLIRHGHIPETHPDYRAIRDLLAKSFDPALSYAA